MIAQPDLGRIMNVICGLKRLLAFTVFFAVAAGCSTYAFDRVDDLRARGRTVAVLAGINNDLTELAVSDLAGALTEQTRFQVLPTGRVQKALPDYPVNIRGPYRFAYMEIEPDYANTDVKKLKALSEKLGTDYLLVIWAPSAYSVSSSYGQQIYQMQFITQMFEFPEGREVGRGTFGAYAGDPKRCFAPRPEPREAREQLRLTMGYVAKRIGKVTGMEK